MSSQSVKTLAKRTALFSDLFYQLD